MRYADANIYESVDAVEDLEGGIELEFAENVSGNGNENGEEQAEGDQAQQEENRRQAQTVICSQTFVTRKVPN